MNSQDWSFLGANLQHFVVGGVAGLIRGFNQPDQSYLRRAFAGVAGAFSAAYGTPFVAPIVLWVVAGIGIPIAEEAVVGAVGFLLGYGGLTLCDAVVRRARKWIDSSPID